MDGQTPDPPHRVSFTCFYCESIVIDEAGREGKGQWFCNDCARIFNLLEELEP